MSVVAGHPLVDNGDCFNAASVLQGGTIKGTYRKHILPNHSVFDEVRYFTPGTEPLVFEHEGVNFGVVICADVWEAGPATLARKAGAQVLLALNASPFHIDKQLTRHDVLKQRVKETGLAVIYTNLVGGQDELVFDGGSFVLDDEGALTLQLPPFEEALGVIEFDGAHPLSAEIRPQLGLEASVYEALCLGLRDYVEKN